MSPEAMPAQRVPRDSLEVWAAIYGARDQIAAAATAEPAHLLRLEREELPGDREVAHKPA
jgi:hypothetical protein